MKFDEGTLRKGPSKNGNLKIETFKEKFWNKNFLRKGNFKSTTPKFSYPKIDFLSTS